MDVGSIVKFRDGLYTDEVGNTYVVIEDKFNDSGKRQLNALGYHSMKSRCRLCGHEKEHDQVLDQMKENHE